MASIVAGMSLTGGVHDKTVFAKTHQGDGDLQPYTMKSSIHRVVTVVTSTGHHFKISPDYRNTYFLYMRTLLGVQIPIF